MIRRIPVAIKIIASLKERPKTLAMLKAETGMSLNQIREIIDLLKDYGLVYRTGSTPIRNKYVLYAFSDDGWSVVRNTLYDNSQYAKSRGQHDR